MIKININNFLRFLRLNRSFAFINVFGLTLGFSSFLLILFYVHHELSFDQFHQNHERVFRVNISNQDNAGNITTLVNSPPALAPEISGKFPELKNISRMRYAMNILLSHEEIRFYEDHGYYADSLFLEILQFDMVYGNAKTALDQPNSIVITEELALKYFNNPNPIGATLLLNNSTSLKITGILSSIPNNSHLNFDFLISFPTYRVPQGYASDLTSMDWLGFLTYIELQPNSDPITFEEKLAQHFRDLNPENPNPSIPILQNLSDIYLGSNRMTDDLSSHIRSGNQLSVNALMMVALLILIIAGFNFSILTNALSIIRSKSTGIRKVLGANKKSIVAQLLAESLVLTFFCLLLSFGIVFLLFPAISQFMAWEINLGLKEIRKALPFVIAVGILIGTLSSFYPALTLARLDVIKSLKGSLRTATTNPFQLKNVLIMLQFAISIGLISATVIMTKQTKYLREKDLGYNAENVFLIKMLPEDLTRYFELYKEDLMQNASVLNVSRSDRVVGEPWPWSIIQRVDQDPEMSKRVFFNLVDYDFLETMGIPLHSGRALSKEFISDPTKAIIINKQAAATLGFEDAIGQQVHFFEIDGPRTIVGVAEDFNYTSLHQEIGPAVVILPIIDLEHMYVRFASNDYRTQIEFLEDSWKKVSPSTPLQWRFLDDKLDQLYKSEERLSAMIQFFALLTILLACLGLYGIVAFMINNRIKEIGVRKVLGASILSLYTLVIKKYIFQIILALVIAVPLIHYLLKSWLENFAYHIQISWIIYPLSTLLLVLMILSTVTVQILKATRVNPVFLLRSE